MRVPRILSHILDSESKSVTFGWVLSTSAHLFFALRPELFKVEHWVAAQGVAAGLVAGKMIKEGVIESAEIKEAKKDEAPAPLA